MASKSLKLKLLGSICLGVIILISSCGPAPTPVPPSITPSQSPTAQNTRVLIHTAPPPTSTLTPTITPTITITPTPTQIPTPLSKGQPGFVITLGDSVPGPWYPSIAAFSPDGSNLALASSRIRLWNLSNYQLFQELINPYPEGCYVKHLEFSSDGSLLVVSINDCWEEANTVGHLLVYDVNTGELLKEWKQENAHLEVPFHTPYSIGVSAFAFFPDSKLFAFGNGKTIEIRDPINDTVEPIILDLGENMYASQITTDKTGAYLYALMTWDKTNTWPSDYKTNFRVKVWNLYTNNLFDEIGFDEVDYANESMRLVGSNLIHLDFVNAVTTCRDLYTGEITQLPYRRGLNSFSSDLKWLMVVRYVGLDYDEQNMELFNAKTWHTEYTFKWVYTDGTIRFSPDNTLVAITHNEQVSLLNIYSIIYP